MLKNMADNSLPATNYWELLLWVLRRRKRLKIVGNSMLPLLKPGDEILLNPHAYRQCLPEINDIVVTTHPHQTNLIVVKRITAIAPDGNLFLVGDNLRESTDSRHWGTVNPQKILAKVTSRFS
ncbi:MAG: nickel-type superoxide dismutase maturation protease [Waterburya sp.]